jgi:general nucleoside transport system permease protein
MIRIVRKDDTTGLRAALVRVASIVAALAVSVLLVWILGYDPLRTFGAILQGSFGSTFGLLNTVVMAVPLTMAALAVAVAFSMKFWNIGAEGQIVMGAFAASAVAMNLPAGTPSVVAILLCFLAGMVGGAVWALIPGLFRAFLGTNETLFTLMMNYIAIQWVVFLRNFLWKDPAAHGFPIIAAIPGNAFLPKVLGIHAGWILALVLAAVAFFFLRSTKLGYEIRVVGESERTARYAGMDVRRVIVLGVLISGSVAGLTGAVQISGVAHTLSESIGGGVGFTAIIVAWLSNLSPPAIVVTSILFAALKQGSMAMELIVGSPSSLSDVIMGLVLMAALSTEFFLRYRIVSERTTSRKEGT